MYENKSALLLWVFLFCEHVWLLLAISPGLSIGMRNENVGQDQGTG